MTLREWFNKMDPEDQDLNNNMLQLFQMAGLPADVDVKIQEANFWSTKIAGPALGGWVVVVDGSDAAFANLYYDKQLKATWSFTSRDTWVSEGEIFTTKGSKKYHSIEREPEWEEVVHIK